MEDHKPVSHSKYFHTDTVQFVIAHPLDRLAAYLMDIFIILSPVLILLGAPFKRIIGEAILLENTGNLQISVLLYVFTVLLVSFTYKATFTYLYGATLGQLFMSLRVVNIWSPGNPKLKGYLLRSASWVLSHILLGLPFLSVMYDERRRSLHDKVSDTLVLSLKGRTASAPSVREKVLASLIAVFVVFSVLFQAIPRIKNFYEYKEKRKYSHLLSHWEGRLCQSVSKAMMDPEEKEGRLDIAMALYAAKEIGPSCLKKEVRFAHISGVTSGVAYLANAFIYTESLDLSDTYLLTVCGSFPDSESCQMSQIISIWDEGSLSQINDLFDKMETPKSTYVTVWQIQHLYRSYQYEKAMELLSSMENRKSLAGFIGVQTVQLYWKSSKRVEAIMGAEMFGKVMSEDGRLDLNNWLCFEERRDGCAFSKSCEYMRNHWKDFPRSMRGERKMSLTFARDSLCENKDYEYIKKRVSRGGVYDLLMALGSENKRKNIEKFLDKDIPPWLRLEAMREMIAMSSARDMGGRISDWVISKRGWEWERVGRLLFQRLLYLKAWDEVYEVGLSLLSWQPKGDLQLQREVVVSAYHSDRRDHARILLSNYLKRELSSQRSPGEEASFERNPASQGSFFDVVRWLQEGEEEGE